MKEKGGFSAICWLGNEEMLHEEVTAEEENGGANLQLS